MSKVDVPSESDFDDRRVDALFSEYQQGQTRQVIEATGAQLGVLTKTFGDRTQDPKGTQQRSFREEGAINVAPLRSALEVRRRIGPEACVMSAQQGLREQQELHSLSFFVRAPTALGFVTHE